MTPATKRLADSLSNLRENREKGEQKHKKRKPRPQTLETAIKIRAKLTGKRGHSQTPETREKIRNSLIKAKCRGKQVVTDDLLRGMLEKGYSLHRIAYETGMRYNAICMRMSRMRKV